MSVNQSLKDIENIDSLNLHIDEKSLPKQVKVNKSVVGRLNTDFQPQGSVSGYSTDPSLNQEMTFNLRTGSLIDPSSLRLNAKMSLTGGTGTNGYYAGFHTSIDSVLIELGNSKLIDIGKHSDRIADTVVRMKASNDQLKKMKSLMMMDQLINSTGKYTVSLPLFEIFGDLDNLIPTGAISSSLRVSIRLSSKNKQQIYSGGLTSAYTVAPQIKFDNVYLNADLIELQPMVYNTMLKSIQSSGLMIPYHTYKIDTRPLATTPFFNESINLGYSNVVSLLQKPYQQLTAAVSAKNYYKDLKFNATDKMDDITNYLVNFAGSQYYNLNSNKGQSGKALHSLALNEIIESFQDSTPSSGGDYIENIDSNQTLAINFLRSKVSSPYIIDSGVNGRGMSDKCDTSCEFKNTVAAGTELTTIAKYTRRLKFSNSTLEIYS